MQFKEEMVGTDEMELRDQRFVTFTCELNGGFHLSVVKPKTKQ